nr:hypothetical protein [Tanacetum cinerariifolium]
CSKPENPNQLFQKLLEILKELAEYDNSPSRDCSIFLNDDENHSVQNKESLENSSNEIDASNPNQEKEEPPQDFDIRKLIEECCVESSEEKTQNMESMMLELVKTCQEKEFPYIHDNEEEVKNVVEQPAERGNRIIESLQNFKVIRKSSISLKNTSQISSVHAVAPILSTKEPEYSSSMGYKNSNTTPKTESDEIIKSGVEELVPILSENEVTLEDYRECDLLVCENSPVCGNHSDIFSDSNNDDDISVYDDFEDVKYVEASLFDPEIVSVEEENVVHQEEEEVDLEDISQIQDVILREKLLSITHLISNIKSLNDNSNPDCVFNSFVSILIFEESDNSLSDNFSPEFETFCDHTKETRSGNTTHANDYLPDNDSFCFKIEPDQERLINVLKTDISDDSSNDPLLEEADLFLAFDNSIPLGIENFADDSKGDVHFLEELLIDDSILSHESFDSNFEDNPSIEPDQERLINVLKTDISDDSSNDPLLEEADLFLAFDNSIPPGIENFVDDSKGDVHFLEELLIDDSILSYESFDSNFEDNPSVPRPPLEPPDAKTDAGEEIPVVMNDKDKFDEDYYFFMFDKDLPLSD